jgi:hypothetical protein
MRRGDRKVAAPFVFASIPGRMCFATDSRLRAMDHVTSAYLFVFERKYVG